MSAIGIRKSAWQAGTATQRAILRKSCALLDLGQPVLYSDGTNGWFIFDDDRIALLDIAYLGVLCVGLTQLPPGMQPTRQQVIDYVTSRVVLPKDIPGLANASNPWQTVLNAQGAPTWVKAASSVPSSWMAVNT